MVAFCCHSRRTVSSHRTPDTVWALSKESVCKPDSRVLWDAWEMPWGGEGRRGRGRGRAGNVNSRGETHMRFGDGLSEGAWVLFVPYLTV